MLTLPPNVSVLLYREPVNIHKSFDGLIGLIRNALGIDPLTPTFFVFFNRQRNKLKILYWDNDGFAIWYKSLEQGTFHLTLPFTGETSITLTRAQLAMLLEGIDFKDVKKRKRFSKKSA
jgi:transposase